MTTVLILCIAAFFTIMAFWQRSNFIQILAGIVNIGSGIFWLTVGTTFIYIIEATTFMAVGIYLLIMVAVDMLKGA